MQDIAESLRSSRETSTARAKRLRIAKHARQRKSAKYIMTEPVDGIRLFPDRIVRLCVVHDRDYGKRGISVRGL